MLRANHPAGRWVINLLGSVEFDACGLSCSSIFLILFYFLLTFLGVLNGTSQHSINGGLV